MRVLAVALCVTIAGGCLYAAALHAMALVSDPRCLVAAASPPYCLKYQNPLVNLSSISFWLAMTAGLLAVAITTYLYSEG